MNDSAWELFSTDFCFQKFSLFSFSLWTRNSSYTRVYSKNLLACTMIFCMEYLILSFRVQFVFFSCFSSSVPTCFVNQTIADKQQQKHISEGWKRLRKIFNSLPNYFFFSRWLINLIEIVSTSFIFGSSHLVNRPLVNKTKCWSSLVFDNSLVLRIFLFS